MFRSCKDSTFPVHVPSSASEQPKTYNYRCDYCSDVFNSETETDIHMKYVHKSEINNLLANQTIICKVCFIVMPNEEELLEHIKYYHLLSSVNCNQVEKEIFVCDHCEQIFFNKDLLATHYTIIHGTKKKNTFIPCLICSRNIKRNSVWGHFQNHHILSITCCPICYKKFKSRSEMLLHAHTSHQNKYICSTCGYDTHRKVYFHQHVEKHEKLLITSQISTPDIGVSKYFIPNVRIPWKHYRRISGFKGYSLQDGYKICILCKQICLNSVQMNHHIMYDHRPEIKEQKKSYSCTCGENFSNKILLKHHIFKLKGNHKEVDETSQVEDSNQMFYYVIKKIDPAENSGDNIVICPRQAGNTEQTATYYINNIIPKSEAYGSN